MTMLEKPARSVRILGGGAIVALTVGLVACGGPNAGESDDGAGDSSAIVTEATAQVDQFFANNDEPFALEPVPDPEVLRNKKVMYLSAGLSSPSATAGVAAFNEVQDALGFEAIIFDGKFTPSQYQEGMRQAVAQNVDALVVYGVDCAGNEGALGEVRSAGIPIIGLQSVDCNEKDPGAEGLFDAQPLYPIGDEAGTVSQVWAANAAAQADYLISKLDGDVRAIQFDVADFAVTASAGEGFRDRMAECSTCEIVGTVVVGVADFGPALQGKAEQALLKNPDANAVQVPYDDLITLGISTAVSGAGNSDEILVVAGGGQEATMDLIRGGNGLTAGWVEEYEWDHYAVIDTLMRVLAGEESIANAHPVILYDKDNNMPESGAFVPGVDFKSVFREAWGLE